MVTIAAPATVGTYTYTLTCSHIGGSGSASVTVQVVPPPTLTFTVNGQSSAIVPPYTSFTLAWNSSNASSCSATNAWSGSRAVSGSTSSNQKTVGTYTYTLTCTGPAGTITKSVIVTVVIEQCPPACGGGDAHWRPPQDEPIVTAPLRENMNWSSEPPTPKSHHLARPPLQGGSSTIIRTTYSLAGQTIATRVTGDPNSANNGLFYILSDHLGSTSLLTTSNGSVVPGSDTWYLPFGGYRGATPTQTITDRDYTGQRENLEIGLLYYNARYYAPNTNRWISPDSIVPDPTNPQSYNRYSYVRNRSLNMTDPTGHSECGVGQYHCVGDPLPTWWTDGSIRRVNVGGYGVFDKGHLLRGYDNSGWFVDQITQTLERGGGVLGESAKSNEYFVDYQVSGNITADRLEGVVWGMYMDFEVGYETFQSEGGRGFLERAGGFAPEDLPSDFIGAWAYLNGYDFDDIPILLQNLGAVTPHESPLSWLPIIGDRGASLQFNFSTGPEGGFITGTPRNYEFTPMAPLTTEYHYGIIVQWQNVPWPSSYHVEPIGPSDSTWQRVD
jgi:RHS repeat-associated protein